MNVDVGSEKKAASPKAASPRKRATRSRVAAPPTAKRRLLYLHFGMRKTGSSSIQYSLFRADDASFNARYIRLGRPNNSWKMKVAFGDHAKLGSSGCSVEELAAERETYLRMMDAQFTDSPHEVFIFSGEGLVDLTRDELITMRNWLQLRVDDIQLVGYARDAKGAMESLFQQRLKAGNVRELDFADLYPAYRDALQPCIDVFGDTQVQVWPFDAKQLHANCVVQDFCHRIGVPFPEEEVVRVNDGLSRDAVTLLFAAARLRSETSPTRSDRKDNMILAKALFELKGPKLRFDPAALVPVMAEFADDLRWIEQRLGRPMSGLGESQPGDVAVYADLEQPSPEALKWLRTQLGDRGDGPVGVDELGRMVLALQRMLVQKTSARRAARAERREARGLA